MSASERSDPTVPIAFNIVKWYGHVLAIIFLLFGGVRIVLGVLDNDHSDTAESVLFVILGLLLITISSGFSNRRVWGWYGLMAVNGLVLISALVGIGETLNLIFLFLSIMILGLLFVPALKAEIF